MAASKGENKRGAPVVWTEKRKEEVFDEIINRMCEGELISEILRGEKKLEKYPNYATFIKWIKESDDLGDRYACAREIQAEIELDEIRKIADSQLIIKRKETTKGESGTTTKTIEEDDYKRKSQMIDARKFRLGKMSSKYSDKLKLDVDKKISVTIEVMEDDQSDAKDEDE